MTHELNSDPPWNDNKPPKYETTLEFRYSLDDNDDYVFDYSSVTTVRNSETLLPEEVDRTGWTEFYRGEISKVALDIHIMGRTQVIVKTVDNNQYNNLFFSPTKPAIKTRENRKHLYGHLEYLEDLTGQPSSSPRANCRVIRFKAKKNGDWNDTEHKFDYYVYLPDPGRPGEMKELRIDPDIKNPSS